MNPRVAFLRINADVTPHGPPRPGTQYTKQTTSPRKRSPTSLSIVIIGKEHGCTVARTSEIDGHTSWPQRTHVACYWCCHTFDGPPIPLPVEYDAKKDRFLITSPLFCSWACAKACNNERKSYTRDTNAVHALTLLHKRVTKTLSTITPAPPRLLLSLFGGPMDIEEFRNHSRNGTMYFHMPKKLMLRHEQYYKRQRLAGDPPENIPHVIAPSTERLDLQTALPTINNETLKLKRPTPLQKTSHDVTQSMGIQSLFACAAAEERQRTHVVP
jgi:hypothetical protein